MCLPRDDRHRAVGVEQHLLGDAPDGGLARRTWLSDTDDDLVGVDGLRIGEDVLGGDVATGELLGFDACHGGQPRGDRVERVLSVADRVAVLVVNRVDRVDGIALVDAVNEVVTEGRARVNGIGRNDERCHGYPDVAGRVNAY